MLTEIELAIDLGRHFDALGVPWLIGGSLASSLLGRPRATDDVDLVADLRLAHVTPLYQRLVGTYYIDEDVVRWAVQTRRTFNVIHLQWMVKADVYCSKQDSLATDQMARRITLETARGPVTVCSAEDIILQKLLWFIEGGGVSDRQWGDLRGVVAVNRDKLDREYLDRYAGEHHLEALLAKLLDDDAP